MTGRRLWAIPGLSGIALLLAMPLGGPATAATAASGLNITISNPGDGQTLTSPTATVSGQVSTAAILANIDLIEVRFSYRGTAFQTVKACGPCGTESTVPFNVASPALDLNGPYAVEVVANGHVLLNGFGVDGSGSRSFAVAVPPGPPKNVTATPQADRSVKLTWTAPATPADFLGYVVYRKTNAGPFAFLGVTKQTSYVDSQTGELTGPVQYQVASVREGVTADDALQTPAAAVAATLPPLPTTSTVPGTPTTSTTAPATGTNSMGGSTTADLSDLLRVPTASVPDFPTPSPIPTPTLPDTGFNPVLPFPSTSAPTRIEGRQQATGASASGAGRVETSGNGDDSNRRALLIPVAAGSVLCVTALHLRWLNRRLAVSAAVGAAGRGPAGRGGGPGGRTPRGPRGPGPGPGQRASVGPTDLEHLPPEPEPDRPFLPDAKPVRVGAGSGTRA